MRYKTREKEREKERERKRDFETVPTVWYFYFSFYPKFFAHFEIRKKKPRCRNSSKNPIVKS